MSGEIITLAGVKERARKLSFIVPEQYAHVFKSMKDDIAFLLEQLGEKPAPELELVEQGAPAPRRA